MNKIYVKPVVDVLVIQQENAILSASVNASTEDLSGNGNGSWEN